MPFKQWIWKDPENKCILIWSMVLVTIQFTWFKYLYPLPNFMPPDSDSYLEAAYYNPTISMWAIGYSKFLRLISSFTSSDFVLVLVQYILLECSLLYFLYTLRYLLLPGKWVFRLLVVCSIMNPLAPHISNFVSSDGLFTTLSLVWFTQLLWILYKPSKRLLIWHAFVLLFAFMVRYNALFYPFISIIVLLFSTASVKFKFLTIGLIVLLLGTFIGRTTYRYYTDTGTIQYSPFGGWLMAGNALYGYAYATPIEIAKVPLEFQPLHAIVNRHMDSIRHLYPRPDADVGIYYVWDERAPLKMYVNNLYRHDSTTTGFVRWAKVAPLYAGYGRYLIQQRPWLFIKHYLWPNFVNYYAPPTKFMGVYNRGELTVEPLTVRWFGWKDNHVATRSREKTITIIEAFTILSAVVNLVYILCFIGFIYLHGFKKCQPFVKHILWWTFCIWFINMAFSLFSAPIELRYQLFPMFTTFVLAVLIIESIIREITKENMPKYGPVLVPGINA